MIDTDLNKRWKNGDEDAWKEIYHLYHDRLIDVALVKLEHDLDLAEEIVQNMFFRLIESRKGKPRRIEQFDVSRAPFPWLAQIVVRECMNLFRKQKPRKKDENIDDPKIVKLLGKKDPAGKIESRENRRKLDRHFENMLGDDNIREAIKRTLEKLTTSQHDQIRGWSTSGKPTWAPKDDLLDSRETNTQSKRMIRTITEMAETLGITSNAEGHPYSAKEKAWRLAVILVEGGLI